MHSAMEACDTANNYDKRFKVFLKIPKEDFKFTIISENVLVNACKTCFKKNEYCKIDDLSKAGLTFKMCM